MSHAGVDTLTLLTTSKGKFASKIWKCVDGKPVREDFDAGDFFNFHTAEVSNIRDLARELTIAESRTDVLVIRGSQIDAKAKSGSRKKHGPHAAFRDASRQWAMFDLDKFELPFDFDLHNPEAAIDLAIEAFPDYFHNVTCYWQLSSSMGFGAPRELRAHLWFWLDRPVSDAELKIWTRTFGVAIDQALFNSVQPHYVCKPRFDGVADPLPQRSGLSIGVVDVVPVPPIHVPPKPERSSVVSVATPELLARATAYIAKLPASTEGKDGHGALWKAALHLRKGFALSEEDAGSILKNGFNSRCEPPWSDEEIDHKLRDAGENSDAVEGYLLPREDKQTGFIVLTTAQILAPLPPVDWLIEKLDMAVGPPTIVSGYGFSAKTISLQALIVALLFNDPMKLIWGMFAARRRMCRALHVDYEQGDRLTRDRYARLIYGRDVGDRLSLITMPNLYIDMKKAKEELLRVCENQDIVLIDSLRAAAPGIDENSSEARAPLDMLTRVSEATGAVFVVIHHSRKPNRDAVGGSKMSMRGSSAIFDACASHLSFEGIRGEPTRVTHEKAKISGHLAPDFSLTVSDATDGSRALYVNAELITEPSREEREQAAISDVQQSIRSYLLEHGGVKSVAELRDALGLNRDVCARVFKEMVRSGEIRNMGTSYHSRDYRLAHEEE